MWSFDRWRALNGEERLLTIQSGMAIAVTLIALRVLGVDRTLRTASRPLGDKTKTVIGDVAAAVDRAGRYVPGATCLPQSVALAWLLRRRGIDARVCIGARTDNGRFDAHAWVEEAGVAINHAPPGYTALLTSSPPRPAP
jgi:hypothetical protein